MFVVPKLFSCPTDRFQLAIWRKKKTHSFRQRYALEGIKVEERLHQNVRINQANVYSLIGINQQTVQ